MVSVLKDNNNRIAELCRQFGVKRLALFGSATTKEVMADVGDLDFLVEFGDVQPGKYADCYFGLIEGLERLFNIEVDLVEEDTVDNPYLKVSIEKSKVAIYELP
jgi:hypothetical protein